MDDADKRWYSKRLTAWLTPARALAGAVIIGLATWGAINFVEWAYARLRPGPPSLTSQLRTIIHDSEATGYRVLVNRPADFHGTGEVGRLLVLRSVRYPQNVRESDEIRIYDTEAGRLRLKFHFRPNPKKMYISWASRTTLITYEFTLDAITDIDGDGSLEITGAYGDERFQWFPLYRPVIIAWDAASEQYVIEPVLTGDNEPDVNSRRPPVAKPSNSPPPCEPAGSTTLDCNVAQRMRNHYVRTETLYDPDSDTGLKSFATHNYVFRRSNDGRTYLIAGFIVRASPDIRFSRAVMQVIRWQLDMRLRDDPAVLWVWDCFFQPDYRDDEPVLITLDAPSTARRQLASVRAPWWCSSGSSG